MKAKDYFRARQTMIVVKQSEAKRRVVLREKAANAQSGLCIYCAQPFTEENPLTYEHIVPKSKGGLTTPGNTAASCKQCNNERGSANHFAFLRYKQAERDRSSKEGRDATDR